MTADLPHLANVIQTAADLLDSENHRYVERFAPCPNGCTYDYASGVVVDGQHRDWPTNTPPVLVQTSGPDDCDLCDDGTIDDDDAPWLTTTILELRAAAIVLGKIDLLTAWTGPDRETPDADGTQCVLIPYAALIEALTPPAYPAPPAD